MRLDEALKASMDACQLDTHEVVGRMLGSHSRATAYRLLAGSINDPRLSTFIGLCRAVQCSPTELLELAGLWERRERSTDTEDLRLRKVFGDIQSLPAQDKHILVEQIGSLVRAWSAARPK